MDCSLPGSSIHGILQTRILEWVAISFSRRSAQPRDWTGVCHNAGRLFTIRRTTRKALPTYSISSSPFALWPFSTITSPVPSSSTPILSSVFQLSVQCIHFESWKGSSNQNYMIEFPPKSVSLVVLSISVNVKSLFPFAWVKSSDLSLTFLTPYMESIRKTCGLSSRIYLDAQHFFPLLSWAKSAPSTAIDP